MKYTKCGNCQAWIAVPNDSPPFKPWGADIGNEQYGDCRRHAPRGEGSRRTRETWGCFEGIPKEKEPAHTQADVRPGRGPGGYVTWKHV